jgi:hypothetical protein
MRKRIGTAATVAVLAVMIGGMVGGTTVAQATVNLDLLVPADGGGAGAFLDFEHDGLRIGDRIVARSPLYDGTGAHQVGKSFLECVVVSNKLTETSGLWRCSYLLDLADGDILVEGLDPRGDGPYTMAIAGGTGAYSQASGDADFVDSSDGTAMHLHLET